MYIGVIDVNNLKRIILLFVISIIGINPLFVYAGNPQIGSTWGGKKKGIILVTIVLREL